MLTIYRASAGAGKTHRLTGEYLALLFAGARDAYRRILAVTFTNKATDEMKSRIVSELHALASGAKSDYAASLSAAYGQTEEEIRCRAAQILADILNDYSAFNISTIDRFFQQTMRAFTREIGLAGGYEIEMDSDAVLSSASDSLMMNLDKPENKDLMGWLINIAEDKIEDNKGWNIRGDITRLGKELFKESYSTADAKAKDEISDKKLLKEYKATLHALIANTKAEAKRLGEEGLDILEKHGLKIEDFSYGKNNVGFFTKLIGNATGAIEGGLGITFLKMANDPNSCIKKDTPSEIKEAITRAFEGGLNDCVKKVVDFFSDLTNYYTACEIIKNFNSLGILADLSREIADYRREHNVMMISDTTELLGKIIGGSDAPFIYEKTGTRVDHFMIDEFQDTSVMQWRNFRPLLKESLANGRDNLIVGDVKQSIYRFRNSDWKLLEGQVKADFRGERVSEETLTENWRSARHIVEFNNAIFTALPATLQKLYNETLMLSSLSDEQREAYKEKITSVYRQCSQEVAPPFRERDGHVRIEFLDGENKEDWQTKALDRLPGVIDRLQDNGYEPKDIAILVRKNNEAAKVADRLLSYKKEHPSDTYCYDIISNEALILGSSPFVRFMISVIRHLQNPKDEFCEQAMRYSYRVMNGLTGEAQEEGAYSINTAGETFPQETLEELRALSHCSLYELSEGIARLFASGLGANDMVFVQALLDKISEFSQKGNADTERFLDWWDDEGCEKTIQTPDNQNAIRILTVHKSKGLGFKAVIVPFCGWTIDHNPTEKKVIMWCNPIATPFSRLHLVPVKYEKNLGNTIFADDYFRERLHAFIDNLNVLYVAFTRAKEELIVFSPRPKEKKDKNGNIQPPTISSVADALFVSLPDAFSAETGIFELGDWWHTSQGGKDDNAPKEIAMTPLCPVSPDNRLHLRLHGKEYFFNDTRRKHGTLMHEVLSRIHTRDDIPTAVENYRRAGVINRNEAEELALRLNKFLSNPKVASWYDGSARVLNEVEIIFGKGLARRPDRVMITADKAIVVDYKFGEIQDKRYQTQVRNYMRLIRRMGFEKVEGYLWYVELGTLETVDEE